jgi:hypothetical protein
LKNQGQQAINHMKYLGDIRNQCRICPAWRQSIRRADPVRRRGKMDIVIMGTLWKTWLDRLPLGSVAGNLVRHSKVPVMVVSEKCKSWSWAQVNYKLQTMNFAFLQVCTFILTVFIFIYPAHASHLYSSGRHYEWTNHKTHLFLDH